MPSRFRCCICGSADLPADLDGRSPLCRDCRSAADHVVSMQRGRQGEHIAVCGCGWSAESKSCAGRERHVRSHWNAVIATGEAGPSRTGPESLAEETAA